MKIATLPSFSNVVVGVLLLCAGYSFREPGETVVVTRVDTIPFAAYRDSTRNLRLTASSLRDRLAARGVVQPRAILRTDTLVLPPDTVLQVLQLSASGVLSLAPLIRSDSLWAPEVHSFDVGSCDDGFSWAAGELVCDRARFGHLSMTATAGAAYPFWGGTHPEWESSVGLEWVPAYRSGWRGSLFMNWDGRVTLGVTRAWRVF